MRQRAVCALVVAFAALGFAVPAHAQQAQFTNANYVNAPAAPSMTIPLLTEGNIKLGPLALHPHYGMSEIVTDNQFRVGQPFGTRQRDSITTYNPGMQAQLPLLDRHKLVLDYVSNIERHSRFHLDNIEDQSGAAQLLLDFPGGLKIRGLAEWKDGHDPRGSAVATAGVGSTPNKWFTSTYGGEALMESQTFARLRLKSTRWEFIGVNAGPRDGVSAGDINTRNRLENYSALALGGRVAPKTYLFVEGTAEQAIYEINKQLDSSTYTENIGAKWEATAKTQGELKFGLRQRYMATASPRGAGKFNGFNMDGNILWRPQERTQVTLAFYRKTNETVLPGTTFFVSTGTNLTLTHAFTQKWRATANFSYNKDRYSDFFFTDNKTLRRIDNYFTGGVGLWYQIQPWLGARATYTYNERLSNSDSAQYNANFAMLSLQAQF